MNNDNPLKQATNNTFASLGIRADLAGKGYVNLFRCSGISQVDTSPEGQKQVNDAYAGVQQMRWAGFDVYADAVSGSQTFNREDIEELKRLKKLHNNFEVAVVFELGRVTRGGIRHGNVVEDELRKAGIELVSSTELIPDGPIGDLIKAVKHFSNQQQAYNISKSVARGLAQSLAKSTRPAAGRTNLGLDRLYLGPDGKPRTLIRWDGNTQLRLDPESQQVISRALRQPTAPRRIKGRVGPLARKKKFIGYKKQDDEISVFVPGSEQAVKTVRDIFRWYYIEDLGAHKIIKRLRAAGIASSFGGVWNMSSIFHIVENPIYIGIEVRHRYTRCIYHMVGADGPIPVHVDQDKLEADGHMCLPHVERDRNEWELVDKPRLKDFLPPEIRAVAIEHIMKLFDVDVVTAKQARRSKKKSKHANNPYVLSHLLHSKQTGHPMRGDTNSVKRKDGSRRIRRYYFDYSTACFALTGVCATRVPAPALEDTVVPEVFKLLLQDRAWIEQRVRSYLKKSKGNVRDLDQERAALIAERDQIAKRLKRVHKTCGGLTDEELEAVVAEDNARVVEIRHLLTRLVTQKNTAPQTPETAIAAVMQRLQSLPTDWRKFPSADVKQFLGAVVEKLEIDLETHEVEMKVRLPEQALHPIAQKSAESDALVSFKSSWRLEPDTNSANGVFLGKIKCRRNPETKCYTCNRPKMAA